jgi:four helix bundle protein
MSEKISSFRELRVYQQAFALQQTLFKLSRSFPTEEKYSLIDQIRRSSRSIGANISEAWHKRRYVAHFVSKLTDADAEQAETQHWIDTAAACEYLSVAERDQLIEQCRHVGAMLGSMMTEPEKFCRSEPS